MAKIGEITRWLDLRVRFLCTCRQSATTQCHINSLTSELLSFPVRNTPMIIEVDPITLKSVITHRNDMASLAHLSMEVTILITDIGSD